MSDTVFVHGYMIIVVKYMQLDSLINSLTIDTCYQAYQSLHHHSISYFYSVICQAIYFAQWTEFS